STGSTSASAPGQVVVSVNPASLAPGVYRGSITFASAGSQVRAVNVALIVSTPVAGGSSRTTTQVTLPCPAAQLVPASTGLATSFSAPTSWPTPLIITLIDTCGTAVGNGQIVT